MALSGRTITSGKPFSDSLLTSTTKEFEVGTPWKPNNDPLGRRFRYTLNGAVALDLGTLIQSKVSVANHQEHVGGAGTTGAAGQNLLQIGLTMTTAMTEDEFRGGSVCFPKVTGAGQIYPIKNNTASVTPLITLAENIVTAVDTTTEFTFVYNPYHAVIVLPTTQTAPVVGVPRTAVPANSYFWLQVTGQAAVLVDTGETIIINNTVGVPHDAAVAGACGINELLTEGTPNTITNGQAIGHVITVAPAAEYAVIDLDLDHS